MKVGHTGTVDVHTKVLCAGNWVKSGEMYVTVAAYVE